MAHLAGDVGYNDIVRENGCFGLTESGVKNVCERLRETGATERKVGSGRKKVVRTESKVGEAMALTLGNLAGGAQRPPGGAVANPRVTCGEAS